MRAKRRRFRPRGAVGAAVVVGLLCAGCPPGGSGSPGGAAGPPPAAAGPPARVVSLAPSVTELVFALGAGDRLVGVTGHCDYPPEAAALPRVGGYQAPSVEAVVAVRPDVVLVPAEGNLLGPFRALERAGLRVEPVDVASLDDLYAACETLGRLLGRGDEGSALAEDLRARADAVAAAIEARTPVPALLVVDHQPTVAAGRGTFAGALLEAAGGRNVAASTTSGWPHLSGEAIVALAPEVVIDTSMAGTAPALRERAQEAFWERLRSVPAVQAGRVRAIEPDIIVRPGPRLLDGLEAIARALHPDAFAAPAAPAGAATQ